MSEYWYLHCKDCNESCRDEDYNHGDDALLGYLKLIPTITEFEGKLPQSIDIDINIQGKNAYQTVRFARDHKTHNIVVMSELGRFYTMDGVLHEKQG